MDPYSKSIYDSFVNEVFVPLLVGILFGAGMGFLVVFTLRMLVWTSTQARTWVARKYGMGYEEIPVVVIVNGSHDIEDSPPAYEEAIRAK